MELFLPNPSPDGTPNDAASPTSRRQWLQPASAASLGLSGRAWSQTRFDSNAFKLGVASGSPERDAQFTRIVQRGQVQAVAELAHSVHVEPVGLEPDRWYFYRFLICWTVPLSPTEFQWRADLCRRAGQGGGTCA